MWVLEWLLWGCLLSMGHCAGHMDVVHSWSTVDYAFPNQVAKDAMIRTGRYIPHNIAVIDVDIWEGGGGFDQKIFVTMPRLKSGNPASLATVSSNGALEPYPNWNWHGIGNCDGITSVFRIEVDQCGRLWVLDTGIIDTFENPTMICRPKIHVFNLYNDKPIVQYEIPQNVADARSLLVTIVVDTRDAKCLDTYAYIADVTNYRLIVFDAANQRSWTVTNNYFYPYPLHGTFNINGVTFDLMDGVLGLALGPIVGNDRRLYFHSLASVRESWVSANLLRNQTLFTEGDGSPRSFHVSQYTRSSQSAAEAMSSSGILFFGLLSENSIACWNSRLPYTRENIITIAKNRETLQFSSGLKYRNDKIWVLTSRLQNYIVNNVTMQEVNYRVLKGDAWELTVGTSCRKRSNQGSGYQSSGYKPLIFNP